MTILNSSAAAESRPGSAGQEDSVIRSLAGVGQSKRETTDRAHKEKARRRGVRCGV